MAGLLLVPALLPGGSALGSAQPFPLPVEPLPLEPLQAVPMAMTDEAFAAVLAGDELPAFEQACQESARFDLPERLRQMRERLLELRPAPQPFDVVITNANALISCRAPEAALTVLDRYGPAAGTERQQWLIQQWRAANAGLNHRRAAEALRRLAAGDLASLEFTPLPMRRQEDGSLETRPALDVLADHLAVQGHQQEAAALLLAGRLPGRVAAQRLQRAALVLETMPIAERNRLLDMALDQAAAAAAWGLAAELLDLQASLQQAAGTDSSASEARRLRLSQRIDDAYAEWLLRRNDPAERVRAEQLERALRSPRSGGGHTPTPSPAVPLPSPPAP
ncbi:hypothetical protein KQ302_09410 [Synechococcus sp. CS-602]|uniref:hypothetical protein n=2 Tax=Synechococcales TaxID=1890424 RepID=UPI0008FF1570|nr:MULTISPECIES: hypothetical protein [Synechococcaceae]APD48515.1 hypothetical protein BM449_10085 [Synechococcus sp. SynAce01]MCT0205310.1 hypothetical protein [Synechococcus sp. CS-602]MCT4367893.1 hypothetical protein [Candidatus Regnicoccus frigidus MAG-AL2]